MEDKYKNLERKLDNQKEIVLKKSRMRDFFETENLIQYIEEREYEDRTILYLYLEIEGEESLIMYEIYPEMNIAKVIYPRIVRDKLNVLKVLNKLNCSDMNVKYALNENGMVEISTRYRSKYKDFNAGMLYMIMDICINEANKNIKYIFLNDIEY